jgi:hypothetical protein
VHTIIVLSSLIFAKCLQVRINGLWQLYKLCWILGLFATILQMPVIALTGARWEAVWNNQQFIGMTVISVCLPFMVQMKSGTPDQATDKRKRM